MHRTNRHLLLVLALVTLMAAPAAMAGHAWGSYHWARESNPFTLKLGDNVSSAWDPYLATTSIDWSLSSVLDTTIVAGGTRPRNCRATSGRVEVCSDAYGNTGWLGVAQIWASGNHITQAIVKVNDTYYASATYNTPAWRNLVMCQEVGHAFGLAHQDENFDNAPLGTCMDYSNDPVPNQHPNTHDYDQLESIYAHLDASTTVGQSIDTNRVPPAFVGLALDGPGQWGRLVEQSEDGHHSTFQADFGNGFTVTTHVLWAAE